MSVHTHSAPFLLKRFCHVEDFFPRERLSFFFSKRVDFWRFLLVALDATMFACASINANAFAPCVYVLYLEIVARSTLSPVRLDGDIPAEMRGGEGSSKGASRWPGRMGTEKKMCIRSHCASNVITGSDSSMWHAALPICQSEIGRVTNGYHCYFPQPPPPPPPTLMSVSFSSAGGEE